MNINSFLLRCDNHKFIYAGRIIKDESIKKTHFKFSPHANFKNIKGNIVYIITKNNNIVKIGGSKNGWNSRWNSYLCGRHSLEMGGSGKCSVTNKNVYSWLMETLKHDNDVEIYVWTIPSVIIQRNVLGIDVEIKATIYEVYETRLIELYFKINSSKPELNYNSDPSYR